MKIKELAKVVSGATPKTNVEGNWGDNYLWITPAEIKDNTKYVRDTERKLTDMGLKSASLNLLPKGTVLLSSRAPIGKVAIADVDMYCNQGFKNLICNLNLAFPEYVYYWLSSKTEYLKGLGRGATFKEISKSIVEEIEIPLPNLEIQKKIAQTLDTAQSLIDKRKEQITACDELIKSLFYEMFGDPVTNPKKYDSNKLVNMAKVISGGTPSRDNPEYFEGKIPWITTVALKKTRIGYRDANEYITEESVKKSATKIIPAGSLLVGIRVGVGRLAINTVDMCTSQDIVALVEISSKFNIIFLIELLKKYTSSFNSQKRGATIQGITSGVLKETVLIIPPIELQNTFAQKATQIEHQKSLLQQSLTDLEQNFSALMQKAFKGELFPED